VIRLLLAEDQAMVRGALKALLAPEDDITVVAEVARGDEVVAAAIRARVDVALLDISRCRGSMASPPPLRFAPSCRSADP